MNEKELAELAAWTARAIRNTIIQSVRKLDDAGEDIIREYIQADLRNWQRGEKITFESSTKVAQEITSRRRHKTKTFDEVFSAIMILCTKFHDFVTNNLCKREAEVAKLAVAMPAVKV